MWEIQTTPDSFKKKYIEWNRERETETDRCRDRETERQRQREQREREREGGRERECVPAFIMCEWWCDVDSYDWDTWKARGSLISFETATKQEPWQKQTFWINHDKTNYFGLSENKNDCLLCFATNEEGNCHTQREREREIEREREREREWNEWTGIEKDRWSP